MTIQEVKLLFAYDSWAMNKFFDALELLPSEQLLRDMKTSHTSIHGTMVHIVGAEKLWCSRWTGVPTEPILTAKDVPTLAALKEIWTAVGFDTAKFVGGMTDKKLGEIFETTTAKGEVQNHVYWQTMVHVITHSSYHRGQVVTMLRQQGTVPPSSGMNLFFRETAKLGTVRK